MNPLQEVKDNVTEYFSGLGYQVTWDFSRRTGEEWYEIMEDDELVAQIDKGVPLADIIEDLLCLHRGLKKGTSKSDYKISTGDEDDQSAFKRLLEKVYASTQKL
jgi:hypothetical protein